MAIHPAATFLYRLVLPETEAPWLAAASLEDPTARTTGDDEYDARLVGHSPAAYIWGDRIALIARQRRLAARAAAFIAIDPDITRHLQGGDVLWLVHTGAAGLGASVVRNERLVLAVGAVTAVPCGGNVQIVSVREKTDPTTSDPNPRSTISSTASPASRQEALTFSRRLSAGSNWRYLVKCICLVPETDRRLVRMTCWSHAGSLRVSREPPSVSPLQ